MTKITSPRSWKNTPYGKTRRRATYVAKNHWKLLRTYRNPFKLAFKLVDKTTAQTWAFTIIPAARLYNLELRSFEEPNFPHQERAFSLALN